MPISKNLFDYATPELSQDAFICWLCAQFDSEDPHLRHASQNLLHKFLNTKDNSDVHVTCIYRQRHRIDILIYAEHLDVQYAIIIEDKIRSGKRDSQPKDYIEKVKDDNEIKAPDSPLAVYYKTETIPELPDVEKRFPTILGRDDILDALTDGVDGCENLILNDYANHLQQRCAAYNAYSILPIKEWKDEQFCGFYEHLRLALKSEGYSVEYGRNSNRNGGHWTCWFGNKKKVGKKGWNFQINIEPPSKNQSSANWLLRCVVRFDNPLKEGEPETKSYSRRYFELPEINDNHYATRKSKFTIMGKLFEIGKDSDEANWGYEEVGQSIRNAIEEYEKWCDDNLYKNL